MSKIEVNYKKKIQKKVNVNLVVTFQWFIIKWLLLRFIQYTLLLLNSYSNIPNQINMDLLVLHFVAKKQQELHDAIVM